MNTGANSEIPTCPAMKSHKKHTTEVKEMSVKSALFHSQVIQPY